MFVRRIPLMTDAFSAVGHANGEAEASELVARDLEGEDVPSALDKKVGALEFNFHFSAPSLALATTMVGAAGDPAKSMSVSPAITPSTPEVAA